MAQELMDFDEWVELQRSTVVEYYVVYDNEGMIKTIGPEHSLLDFNNKVKIDDDIAVAILEGRDNVFAYRVDIPTKKVVKLNKFATHTLTKIDDVLHRIVDRKWSLTTEEDIRIVYNSETSALTFSMNEKYKKLILEGDTDMNFLVTEYNDPNILLQMITFKVGDLAEKEKVYAVNLQGRFSVYTRRIFDRYVIDTL